VEQAGQGVYRGHEGATRSLADWTEDFDDFEVFAEEFLDKGDHVIVRTRQTGSGKASGIPMEGVFWFVCRVREGKVVRVHVLNTERQPSKPWGSGSSGPCLGARTRAPVGSAALSYL